MATVPEPDPPFDLDLPMFPPSRPEDVISLIVKVERGKVTDVFHVARTRAHTGLPGALETTCTAALRDADGVLLAEGALLRLNTAASGCGCDDRTTEPATYLAQAFIPNVGAGAALEITDGDDVVWRRAAPERPPEVEGTEVNVDRRGNVTVSWRASGEVAEFWLLWSRDGETWQTLIIGVTDQKVRLAARQVPTGEGLLQVVAHDGFFSSYGEPVSATVAGRPAEAIILHPIDGYTYVAGQSIRLWALSTDLPDDVADEAQWLIDGAEVARGLDAWTTLDEGEHTITIRLGGRDRGTSVTVSATA